MSQANPHNAILLAAASAGDARAVRNALQAGAEPGCADTLGNSGLHIGCAFPDVVGVLLEAGAPLDAWNWHKETPLHRAASTGPWASAKAMLDAGGDWLARFEPPPGEEATDAGEESRLAGTPLFAAIAGGAMEATLRTTARSRSDDVIRRERALIAGRCEVLDGWLCEHPDASGVATSDLYLALATRAKVGQQLPCGAAETVAVLARHGLAPEPWPRLLVAATMSMPLLQALLGAGMDVRGTQALEVLAARGLSPPIIQSMADLLQEHGAQWSSEAIQVLSCRWKAGERGWGSSPALKPLLENARARLEAQGLDEAMPVTPRPSAGARQRI